MTRNFLSLFLIFLTSTTAQFIKVGFEPAATAPSRTSPLQGQVRRSSPSETVGTSVADATRAEIFGNITREFQAIDSRSPQATSQRPRQTLSTVTPRNSPFTPRISPSTSTVLPPLITGGVPIVDNGRSNVLTRLITSTKSSAPASTASTPTTSITADQKTSTIDTSPFHTRQKRNIFKQWTTFMNDSNYDKYLIPKMEEDKPLEVTVSIMVIRIHSVSDADMDFGIEMYYRERWIDYRLAYDPTDYDGLADLNLPMAAINYVWKPDTYFLNAISAEVDNENSVTHRAFLRVNTTGHVHYSRKISLKADCPMDLSMYPFDKQYCKLKLGTYSHSSKDLVYNWAKRGHDVELKDKIVLPEFYGDPPKTTRLKLYYTTGSFDSLELCIKFKRSAGFCVLQVFIPATAVVMSSWVALWMAEDTTFSDVLAVILAIIFLAYAYNSVMPRVSYVKLLDLYMCSCFLFVFLSLFKLVIIKYFCKKWAKENNRSSDWFLTQLAGISLAQQQQQQEDAEKGQEKRRRSSIYSDQSKNGHIADKKQRDSIDLELTPDKAPSKKNVRVVVNLEAESLEADEDYASVLDKKSQESGESDHFLMAHTEVGQVDEEETTSQEGYADNTRRMTFLGLEAFSAWFNEKEKKNETQMERRMRLLRWFHVVTQLALPIGFGAFFIFLLLVYPNVPDKRGC